MFAYCRQESAIFSSHFHTTWGPSFRDSRYRENVLADYIPLPPVPSLSLACWTAKVSSAKNLSIFAQLSFTMPAPNRLSFLPPPLLLLEQGKLVKAQSLPSFLPLFLLSSMFNLRMKWCFTKWEMSRRQTDSLSRAEKGGTLI